MRRGDAGIPELDDLRLVIEETDDSYYDKILRL